TDPASARPRPDIEWEDGAHLPSYFFDGDGLGHTRMTFRGPAHILAGLQRFTPPDGGREHTLPISTWNEIKAALEREPASF
ncbi:hypothetical protein, partial [Escherichia coli]|uniref:hypothetical protein n=1 Tax=Escherichia coli TaxID=562 RepID=UPI00215B66C6